MDRENLIKNRLDVYCKYLLKQSNTDLHEMIETNTLTVVDAAMKREEDNRG